MTALRQLDPDRPDRAVTRCQACGAELLVRFSTDGNGRLVEEVERCRCREAETGHAR